MKYFSKCKCLEDLKKEYKHLAMENHPDRGGDTATMQEINSEYDIMFQRLKNVHRNAENEIYTSVKENTETPEEYRDIINQVVHFEGVKIEIIGRWIWLSENTYPYKEQIKALKFRFSGKKCAWYYHTGEYHKIGNKTFTLDDIREMFGSETITGEKRPILA